MDILDTRTCRCRNELIEDIDSFDDNAKMLFAMLMPVSLGQPVPNALAYASKCLFIIQNAKHIQLALDQVLELLPVHTSTFC